VEQRETARSPAGGSAAFDEALTEMNALLGESLDHGQALQRIADLHAEVAAARGEAEELNATLIRLLDLAPQFGAEESFESSAAAIARVARDTFAAATGSVWLSDGVELELVARDPPADGFEPGRRIEIAAFPAFAGDFERARVTFLPDLVATYPELAGSAARLGTRSLLRMPLSTGERVVGLIVVGFAEPQPKPNRATMALAQRLADLAALTLEDARRRQAQTEWRRLHAQLEASLLPPLPTVTRPAIRVATRYRAGEQRMLLGGDFIDAVERADGSLAAIIGDVAGHGPSAAALGATLRAAWRGLALARVPLVEVVAALDELLRRERPEDALFATVCALQVDPGGNACELVCAGHPPPILVDGHGPEELAAPVNPPLGYGIAFAPGRTDLHAGASLLLYTDGLIEGRAAPGSPARFGVDRLLQALRELELQPDGLDALLQLAEQANGGPLADDTALLLLQRG
jgi:serine phosphatase RsbU (regulator of sigma subunit)